MPTVVKHWRAPEELLRFGVPSLVHPISCTTAMPQSLTPWEEQPLPHTQGKLALQEGWAQSRDNLLGWNSIFLETSVRSWCQLQPEQQWEGLLSHAGRAWLHCCSQVIKDMRRRLEAELPCSWGREDAEEEAEG